MLAKLQPDSFQKAVFAKLVAAEPGDWLRAGDLFAAVESIIPLHHAIRYSTRHFNREVNASDARWHYFAHNLTLIGVVWEREHGKRRAPGERVKIKSFGQCPGCGGLLYKVGWSSHTTLECRACAIKVNKAAKSEKAPDMTKAEKPFDAAPKEVQAVHPLVGYVVTNSDRGALKIRNGTIIDVIPSNNFQFGDIAMISYRDSMRVELVTLSELTQRRDTWILRRPGGALMVEAAE